MRKVALYLIRIILTSVAGIALSVMILPIMYFYSTYPAVSADPPSVIAHDGITFILHRAPGQGCVEYSITDTYAIFWLNTCRHVINTRFCFAVDSGITNLTCRKEKGDVYVNDTPPHVAGAIHFRENASHPIVFWCPTPYWPDPETGTCNRKFSFSTASTLFINALLVTYASKDATFRSTGI